MRIATPSDAPISSSVAGSRSRSAWKTGSELLVEYPMSPTRMWPSHLMYWTGTGWSIPRLCLRRAMSAGVMCGFCRYGASGPPGML